MRNWTWSRPITWPMTWRVLVLMLGAVYLPLNYAATQPVTQEVAVSTSYINHYETPCQTAAREKFGVPLSNEALVQWQRDHLNTPEGIAYNKAVAACPKPAKWDFGSMILVGTE